MKRGALACAATIIVAAYVGAAAADAVDVGHFQITTLSVRGHGPFSHAEPGIAIGRDGLALVDAATANTGAPPTFWISRNGGGSWGSGRDFDLSGASTGDADNQKSASDHPSGPDPDSATPATAAAPQD